MKRKKAKKERRKNKEFKIARNQKKTKKEGTQRVLFCLVLKGTRKEKTETFCGREEFPHMKKKKSFKNIFDNWKTKKKNKETDF